MRAKSHHQLGKFLVRHYFSTVSTSHIRAFLTGCTQPDKNPTTYLKGSVRSHWLRGHNFSNSKRYMGRIIRRLENHLHWNLLDYYALGKLIHYTADAFTYAHNDCFPGDIHAHRQYEKHLQRYFLHILERKSPKAPADHPLNLMNAIEANHRQYCQCIPGVHVDSRYCIEVCCFITGRLLKTQITNKQKILLY